MSKPLEGIRILDFSQFKETNWIKLISDGMQSGVQLSSSAQIDRDRFRFP